MRTYSDLSGLRHISPAAALILAAEHERIYRLATFPACAVDLHKWNPYVSTTLSRLGFFKLLNLRAQINEPVDAIIVQKMVSQSDADTRDGTRAIKDLFQQIRGSLQLRVDLSSAVTDAVENVVGHAYPEDWDVRRRRVPFWWLVGAADIRAGKVTLAIYDQGITIPASLPRRWPFADLANICLRIFGKSLNVEDPKDDGMAIDAATALGATSTAMDHRGRGLATIRAIIARCPNGQLRIVSRFGECLYRSDGTREVRVRDVPLLGTLVELEASFDLDGSGI